MNDTTSQTMCLTLVIDQPTDQLDDCAWAIQTRRQIRRPLTLDQARHLRDALDQRLDPGDTFRTHNKETIMWQTRATDTRTIPEMLLAAGIKPDLDIPRMQWILISFIIFPYANWGR